MKMTQIKKFIIIAQYLTLALLLSPAVQAEKASQTKEFATIQTSLGTIKLELFRDKAPLTVDNFIQYAKSGFYNGTVFHRVIPDFMIQGGGFGTNLARKETKAPIKNEAQPFVPNARGTIAMARTNDPNSATSQFFINVKNNAFLNKNTGNPGYAVFGEVTEGMDIADKISRVATGTQGGMGDVPKEAIVIRAIEISSTTVDAD